MEKQNVHKSHPKEFFLHLLNVITLYISAASFLTLIFQFINFYFPEYYEYSYGGEFYGAGLIRGAVASLIIVFPVYVGISAYLNRLYKEEPELKELRIRRWLINFTLFAAALIIIGDLIFLVRSFLEGEVTPRFVLKVLTVFFVAASTFSYYLIDLRDSKEFKKYLGLISKGIIGIVALSVIASFFVIGSPYLARERRLDLTRVNDLQSIQWNIISFWQAKGALPNNLDEIKDETRGITVPVDPEIGTPYTYRKTGKLTFDLCANFDTKSNQTPLVPQPAYPKAFPREVETNWGHDAGEFCFHRTIDPAFYQTNQPKFSD